MTLAQVGLGRSGYYGIGLERICRGGTKLSRYYKIVKKYVSEGLVQIDELIFYFMMNFK